MDEATQESSTPADVLQSWNTRECHFQEDGGASTLGQHNVDDTNTRTKITHIELLGFGVIGTLRSVAYGTWDGKTSALLVMQVDFRASDGMRRYKGAEVAMRFEPGSSMGAYPVVRSVYPTRTHSGKGASSLASSIWPLDEFWVQSRTWSDPEQELPHQITWTLKEPPRSKLGLCQPIILATIVTFSGPFRVTVNITATTGFGLKLRNYPWSRDDPLLFDGTTVKGNTLQVADFGSLNDETLLMYLRDSNLSSLSSSQASSGTLVAKSRTLDASSSAKEATGKSATVYRVRGIPMTCTRRAFVKALEISSDFAGSLVHIHSFSTDPSRAKKLAIVSFDFCPKLLRTPQPKQQWIARVVLFGVTPELGSENSTELVFDTHFEGFSELGMSAETLSESQVDIIAITGLAGHAYGSFKERGGTHMWLQDFLYTDLQTPQEDAVRPPVRILIYGYNTQMRGRQSIKNIRDLARHLRASLRVIRPGKTSSRPLIFIGHSLGGILIKELLILLDHEGSDETDRSNLKACRGALFFGVPNLGMNITALHDMFGEQPIAALLNSLGEDSPFLKNQAQEFCKVFHYPNTAIFSFYETCLSGTVTSKDGKVTMDGHPVLTVPQESATHGRTWEMGPRFVIPIDRTHSDMVKFEKYSNDYEKVLACIQELLSP